MPNKILDWIIYSEKDWVTVTPAEAGLDLKRWKGNQSE